MEPQTESSQLLPYPKHPWDNNENVIWLASRLRIVRNLKSFRFPEKIEADRLLQILGLLGTDLTQLSSLKKPQLLKAEEVNPVTKEYLYEHFLAMDSFHQAHKGEAFVIDDTGCFLAVINMRNHLQLTLVDPSGEIERTWNQLSQMELELEKKLEFAFNPEFGFLTADPAQCGTGLIGSTFLQVPALIHSNALMPVLQKYESDAIKTTGIQGSSDQLIGDVLVVKNRYTLGVTEESIISNLRSFSTHLMLEEKSARGRLKEGKAREARDEVARAYALMKNAYQLETTEALQAISRLKLGLDLGWVTGTSMKDLNRIFFFCRRAHLMDEYHQELANEDLARRRAQYIQRALETLELKF